MHIDSQRKVARCPWKEAKCNAKLKDLMMKPFIMKDKLAKLQDPAKPIVKDVTKKQEAGYEAIVIDD